MKKNSQMKKNFAMKSALRAYQNGGGIACPNCGKYHNGGACYMAEGGDIIARGMQRQDDAIEAMSRGEAAPSASPVMRPTLENHPVNPSMAGGYPTDATPMLDTAMQTMIKLGLRAGGPVKGPGGPTDDKIPAMLSNGEYVLPADTVQAVGKERLDALRAKTHTPVPAGMGARANGGYSGDVFDQFNEALGDGPKHFTQSDPRDERLHQLFDGTMSMANGGAAMYLPEDIFPIPQAPSGSSRLRFMAGGGFAYPGPDGISVDEIPTQTLRTPAGPGPAQPFPGPEGIQVNEIPNSVNSGLDSTIGARAQAAKAARMAQGAATPVADAMGAAGDAVANGARAARTGLGGAVDAVGAGMSRLRALPGTLARGAIGAAGAPLAAYEAAKAGYTGLQTPTEDYAKRFGMQTPNTFMGDLGVRTAGIMTDLGNNLLGSVGLHADSNGGMPGIGLGAQPIPNPGQSSAPLTTGGGGATNTGGEGGNPTGTAIINGRVVSPQEIAALNSRNVIPAGQDGTADGGSGQSFGLTDRGQNQGNQGGGMFHMPQQDFSGAQNARFDALEKQIGPIGHSAARLRALQGLEGDRASMLTSLSGQQSQERVADKGLQATIAQRTWDRNLDVAKFGVEQGRLNRQMAHDNATLGLEQAKYLDAKRGDVLTKQVPSMLQAQGLIGAPDEKGNYSSKDQGTLSRINSILGDSTDVARVPPQHLGNLVKLAAMTGDKNEAQKGVSGYIRRYLLGDQSGGAVSNNISDAMPTSRQNGVVDTYTDSLGRRSTVGGTLRGSMFPGHPADAELAKIIGQ